MDRSRRPVDGTDRMDRFEDLVGFRGTWRHTYPVARVLGSRVSRLGTGLRRAAGGIKKMQSCRPHCMVCVGMRPILVVPYQGKFPVKICIFPGWKHV